MVPATATSRLRAPARTVAVPITSGAASHRRGTRRRSASASSRVRSCGVPPEIGSAPVVSVLPGQHDEQVAAQGRELAVT